MRIGFNLLLWTTHVTEAHVPVIAAIRKTGFDGVEIPIFEGDVAHFRWLGGVIRDHGLAATGVTVLPDQAHSAVSADPAARQGAVDRLRWAVECLHAAGGELLAGPFHQPLGEFTGEGPTAAEKERLVEVHRVAADHAAGAGIALSVEPLNRFECYMLNTVADAADIVRRVDRPNYGFLYDTFHANIEEKDPVGVIAPHIAQINHVHISENDRGTPGKGHVPFDRTIAALKAARYDGWLTIESFSRALPGLAAATRVWRDFFPSRDEVYTDGFRMIRTLWDRA
ncbi:MAG: sugar phosphate isomerase/epimerase [Geminicoccaceae bacterium]